MFQNRMSPTLPDTAQGFIIHQLDHLYLTLMLLSRLASCDFDSAERVLQPRPKLSDYLPIVADFNLPG